MPSFGVPGASELIRTILRLQESIDELAKKKEEVKVNVSLGEELKASSSPGVKATILDRIGRSKQAGAASSFVLHSAQEYRRRTEQARRLREQARTIQEQRQQLHRQRVRMLQGGTSPHHPRFQANVDRERALQRRLHLTERRLGWERHRARRAVQRGEEAASPAMSKKMRHDIGQGVAEGVKAAFKVSMGAYHAAKEVTGQAYVNLHRYGGYSAGGARALATEEIGNTLRAIRISRMTAESAQQFADASQKFKNALEPTMIGIINVTNRIAAGLLGAGANMVGNGGQIHQGAWAGLGAAVGGGGALGAGLTAAAFGAPLGPLGMLALFGVGAVGGAATSWWLGGQVNKDIAENQAKLKKMQEELADENKKQWIGLAGGRRALKVWPQVPRNFRWQRFAKPAPGARRPWQAPPRGAAPPAPAPIPPRRGRRRGRHLLQGKLPNAIIGGGNPFALNSAKKLELRRQLDRMTQQEKRQRLDRMLKTKKFHQNAIDLILLQKRQAGHIDADLQQELEFRLREIVRDQPYIDMLQQSIDNRLAGIDRRMQPNLLTAGVDISWAMTPANPAFRGTPTAPRGLGGMA